MNNMNLFGKCPICLMPYHYQCHPAHTIARFTCGYCGAIFLLTHLGSLLFTFGINYFHFKPTLDGPRNGRLDFFFDFHGI
jgi:hypothetical protein